jgi:ferric-dicitrate binding protein FerR (iron transport regulator)
MNDKVLHKLLTDYIAGSISKSDFVVLRDHVNASNDDTLKRELENMWLSYETEMPVFEARATALFPTIKQQTYVPVKINYWLAVQKYAAVALILVLSTVSLYLYQSHQMIQTLSEQEVVFSSPQGQRASLTLPDGSMIDLNSNSTLSYKQNFGQADRHINFVGEGYFKVAKDADKVFKIQTKDLLVEVLGTTFNFFTYANQNIVELALVEGRVKVSTLFDNSKTEYLSANEKITLNRSTGELHKELKTFTSETAWVSDTLQLKALPLREVLSVLSRRFNVKIEAEEHPLLNDCYSATYTHRSLEEILDVLKLHYHLDVRKTNDAIYISFK